MSSPTSSPSRTISSPLLSLSSWRQFQLFDYTPIRDPNYHSSHALYSDPTLSCITATTTSYLIIAINHCTIKLINLSDLTCQLTFDAYDIDYRITFIEPIHNSNNLFVTLAEKQGMPSIIKLWDISKLLNLANNENKDSSKNSKLDQSEYRFEFQTQVLVNDHSSGTTGIGDNSYPISCFKFNYDLTCLAIGYTNGKVILVRGDLLRDRGAKQRLIYNSGNNDPITGVQFNETEQVLYVTTTEKLLTVATTGRNHEKPLKILSNKYGADLNCTDIDESNQNLIVGLNDSIQFYDCFTKILTINFKLAKSRIIKCKQYLLIVSPEERNKAGVSETDHGIDKSLMSRIVILDLVNNHISFNLLISDSSISHAFSLSNGTFLLLTTDGVLYKINEKSINQQIEIVLQRELFSVAFNLGQQYKLPNETLLRIQILHGDYLYDQNKFDEAIDVYIKCLELFKKSGKIVEQKQRNNRQDNQTEVEEEEDIDEFIINIITKFKEATNISNLTKFLIRLYEKSLANIDHITLLLCCYCKLKKIDNLNEFIDELDLSIENLQELNYELIINLFKECGFYDQVLKLLYKLNQPNLIVDIQLNDLHKPKLALNYMKTLTIDDLLLILIDHSTNLLDSCPLETTELLINVFTGKYQPNEPNAKYVFDVSNNGNTSTMNQPQKNSEKESLEREKSVDISNYRAFLNYLSLQLEETDNSDNHTESKTSQENPSLLSNKEPTYLPPKPNLIYASFTNHPKEFVIFLEASLEAFNKYDGNIVDKRETLLTLLEIYLSLNKSTGDKEWLDKAETLTRHYNQLLDNQALLLLSHIYNFKPGEVIAQEKSGNEIDLFMSCQLNQDVEGCFEILEKYGDTKPQLYELMLKFIISSKTIFDQIKYEDIQVILEQIKIYKLLTPIELVDILTENPDNEFITLGLVKDYFIDYFQQQTKEISNNTKLIEKYEQESTKNSFKLSELSKPFVIQNNKCSGCNLKLDFPVIHFKCKHSFHQKCLSTNLIATSTESLTLSTPTSTSTSMLNPNNNVVINHNDDDKFTCPICIHKFNDIKNAKLNQYKLGDAANQNKENFDVFINSLHSSNDKFKFVSDYIGKGVMEDQ